MDASSSLRFRAEAIPSDAEAVETLVASTGFFTPDEIQVARELVEERLSLGEDSGYYFVFLEEPGEDQPEAARSGRPDGTPPANASDAPGSEESVPPSTGNSGSGWRVVAFACFGPIPCTVSSFDLYWIAVSGERRGQGLGALVLRRAEEAARALGATRFYAETSSTDLYDPTRRFYERTGFTEEARLADFYRPGDGKVIYGKRLD